MVIVLYIFLIVFDNKTTNGKEDISGNEFNSTNILNYKKYHQLHGKSIPKMVIVSYIFLFVFDNKFNYIINRYQKW